MGFRMSIKTERKNSGMDYFTINVIGTVLIYKVYKSSLDGSFEDVFGASWESSDSTQRVNIRGYDSLVVIYDVVEPGSVLSIDETTQEYSGFYSCIFVAKDIDSKVIVLDPIIDNPGNVNLSASVTVSINGETETFEYPINGEYVASSSSNNIPVSNGSYTDVDFSRNQNFSIYIPEKLKNTNLVDFNRNTITNNKKEKMSVTLELKIFSISGKIQVSPVIKGIRVREYDK